MGRRKQKIGYTVVARRQDNDYLELLGIMVPHKKGGEAHRSKGAGSRRRRDRSDQGHDAQDRQAHKLRRGEGRQGLGVRLIDS